MSFFPGCLPEGDVSPCDTYEEARDSLAFVLYHIADGYEEGDPLGDAYEEASRECCASTCDTGFRFETPDGLIHKIESDDD